jgi:predicted dehydrogenase
VSKPFSAVSRRRFIAATALVAANSVLPFKRRAIAGSALNKLNIGVIGVRGKGASNLASVASENIVALCDVDEGRLGRAAAHHRGARRYSDFRRMLEQKDIDAVVISTADHTHALPALMAIEQGRHVYCEKPLAHNIVETRAITEAARQHNVATQMGNQGHAGEGIRLLVEWVRAGVIGPVQEVHCWSDRPCWPQGIERPADKYDVPSELAWDLWLGPSPARPYHPQYHPFKWRGFWDFGTGALGDMGCHIMDGAVWALDLDYPISIEAESSDTNSETAPKWSVVRYEFAGASAPLALTWYDGGKRPSREVTSDINLPDNGALFIGKSGRILMEHGKHPKLVGGPRDAEIPDKWLPRSPGHYKEWIEACKGGPPAESNFNYAGRLTEIVLAGNVALRAGKKLRWNGAQMRAENAPEADQFVRREYRKGWDSSFVRAA